MSSSSSLQAPGEPSGRAHCSLGAHPPLAAGAAPSAPPEVPQGSLYEQLGVDRGATPAQLRAAYRRLLVAAHPDKGGDRDRFEQLQAAYAVLSDPTERIIYDEQLQRAEGGGGGAAGAAAAPAAGMPSTAEVQRGGGATAVVHGQMQGSERQPLRPRCRAPAQSGELATATAAINALRGNDGRGDAAALAAAHLARARFHHAAGQVHHALFDAEEAARLDPALQEAAALLGVLRREAAAAAAADELRCSGSSDSDDDVDNPF